MYVADGIFYKLFLKQKKAALSGSPLLFGGGGGRHSRSSMAFVTLCIHARHRTKLGFSSKTPHKQKRATFR